MRHTRRIVMYSFALFVFAASMPSHAASPAHPKSDATVATAAGNAPASLIDINSATLTSLRSLPGIGVATARKIVAGRPYVSVEDLKARKVLSNGIYDKIRDRISAKGHLNAATMEKPDVSAPGSNSH